MSHPYRTPAIPAATQTPENRNWDRYRAACFVHTLARRSIYLAIVAAYLYAGGFSLFMYLLAAQFPLLIALTFVLNAKCPFCWRPIARGPAQPAYWIIAIGRYPKECTHCHAPVGASAYAPPRPPPATSKPASKRRRRRPSRRLADDVLYDLST